MRRPNDLSRQELEHIVDVVQQSLYLRYDRGRNACVWDPDHEWSGADVCEQLAGALSDAGLVPAEIAVFEPLPDRSHAHEHDNGGPAMPES